GSPRPRLAAAASTGRRATPTRVTSVPAAGSRCVSDDETGLGLTFPLLTSFSLFASLLPIFASVLASLKPWFLFHWIAMIVWPTRTKARFEYSEDFPAVFSPE